LGRGEALPPGCRSATRTSAAAGESDRILDRHRAAFGPRGIGLLVAEQISCRQKVHFDVLVWDRRSRTEMAHAAGVRCCEESYAVTGLARLDQDSGERLEDLDPPREPGILPGTRV